MFNYIWPLALVVISNTVYQICAKSVPSKMNPFAVLVVTYVVGALASLAFFFIFNKGTTFVQEIKQINWAPIVLGIIIVGLEVGWIYAYQAGWQVSVAQIVQSAVLGILLIFVGVLLYKEALTWNKLVGIAACLVGLVFINLK